MTLSSPSIFTSSPALLVFLAAGCAAGCAGGSQAGGMIGSAVDAPVSRTATETSDGYRIQPDLVVASLDVSAGAEEAWEALLRVYEELDIPLREVDASTRTVRNDRWVVSRRLGGQRLSTFLDCGRGATGPNADTHRLELAIASRVVAVSGTRSRIQTELMGTGQNMEGTSNTRVACTSNHQLEYAIAQGVREMVGGP